MLNMTFTIGEVVALLGITPKTVLHYHKIGLLAEPERDANNYRLYSMADITQLQQILRLKQFGLSLKQIELITKSENPDELIQVVLSQHADKIRNEMSRLQHQLDTLQSFLDTPQPRPTDKPMISSLNTFSDVIRRRSSSLSDILVEIERDVMDKLDQFDWDENYELFWHDAALHFIRMLTDEGLFIFWMERYLASAAMDADDLQGNLWLKEFNQSQVRPILSRVLMPPVLSVMPAEDQKHILKLLPSLLYQAASPMQKQFLGLLIKS